MDKITLDKTTTMTPVNELRLPSEEAKFLRDIGISTAVTAADSQNPLWQHRAMDSLIEFLKTNKQEFMTEDFRNWAEKEQGLPVPPSGRAYGAVMTSAFKNKLINHNGYGRTSNPLAHRTPASVWISNQ